MQTPPGEIPPQAPADSEAASEASLVRGGPFYRAQEAVRLVSPERWNLGRRIAFAVCLGWVPLFLITLLSRPYALGSLLKDYTINVRLLIAVPVLLIGQVVMENTFRTIVRHIRNAELLPADEEAKMDHTIARLIRLRDSIVPEIVILVAAYGHFLSTLKLRLVTAEPWALGDSNSFFHLSPAAWYYALVSQLVYQFLLGISLWKWFLWICFLFRLSRLDLQLIPTHPDQHAGIGFLGVSPMAIAPTMLSPRER